MKRTIILVIFFLHSMFLSNTLRGVQHYAGNTDLLLNQKSTLKINKIKLTSDIKLSMQEFTYLTKLRENQIITKSTLKNVFQKLISKKRFTSISFDLEYCDKDSKNVALHVTLKSNWIFKRLILHGVMFGRHKYTSAYQLQPGDSFDAGLHQTSLDTIKKRLKDHGYFNYKLQDELIYSRTHKTITTRIAVKRGPVFKVNAINFLFTDLKKHRLNNNELARLPKVLERKFKEPLLYNDYSKKELDRLVKKIRTYLKRKQFLNNRITLTKKRHPKKNLVALTFSVTLGKQKKLSFSGNKQFSDREIREEIVGTDEPEWLFAPDIIAEQIMYEYYKKGFWNTQVTYKKNGPDGYHFTIEEHRPITVERVTVRNKKKVIRKAGKKFWGSLLKHKQYNQALLDQGVENIKHHYFSSGYWDFIILDKRFVKNSSTKKYRINFTVDKGLKRLFSGFEIADHPELETHDFFKKYPNPFHDDHDEQLKPFNYKWLSEQRLYLMSHFQKQQYWYVDVQPTLIISHSKKNSKHIKIFIRWEVNLGEQVSFGDVIIRGDTTLPFKRIIKEVSFARGDLWDREKIDLTRNKLKHLGVFKSIQIQPYQLSQQKKHKSVLLTLIDDDPAEFRFRLGYFLTSKNFLFKRQSTPKVGSSLILKNPTNRADKLSIDFDWTRFERKFKLDYKQPSLFNFPVTGKLKGYANKYVHPVHIGSSSSAYEASQEGFLLGLSDEYAQHYFWGITVGNEWMRTSRVRGFLKLDKKIVDKRLPYFFIEPSLLIDKLDDRVNPTSGSLTVATLKTMFPELKGSVTARVTFEHAHFYSVIPDRLVLAARLRLGHIVRKQFDQIMPIERFYLGGPYSVRGYEKDALPPIGVTEKDKDGNVLREFTTFGDERLPCDPSITREFTIQGGNSMVNANLELRFPLIGDFGMVLFQDLGMLSQTGFLGLRQHWYPTTGFGLRYKTPIGAIRFDIGWKWKKRLPGDGSYGWYLTIGEAF